MSEKSVVDEKGAEMGETFRKTFNDGSGKHALVYGGEVPAEGRDVMHLLYENDVFTGLHPTRGDSGYVGRHRKGAL